MLFLCPLIVDNGGGMDPDKIRQCMSLGYSAKSKVANTIGQCNILKLKKGKMNACFSSWNYIFCLFYQMAMVSKQVPWGLGQMWLYSQDVVVKVEKGLCFVKHNCHLTSFFSVCLSWHNDQDILLCVLVLLRALGCSLTHFWGALVWKI